MNRSLFKEESEGDFYYCSFCRICYQRERVLQRDLNVIAIKYRKFFYYL